MMHAKTIFTLAAALALVTVGIGTASPGARADSGGGHGGKGTFAFGQPGKPGQAGGTVEIRAGDNFYEPEIVQVKAGETVRFVIRNEGKQVHNFTFGTAAAHAAQQKAMTMMVEHGALRGDKIDREMMKMDMGGGKTMEHSDPYSVLLEPGKAGEIVWTFAKAMTLEFACNVPGHSEAGMTGTIRVGQ